MDFPIIPIVTIIGSIMCVCDIGDEGLIDVGHQKPINLNICIWL